MAHTDPLRRKILEALAAGGLALGSGTLQAAGARPLAAGIGSFSGQVTVNGKPARLGLLVNSGDLVKTGPASQVVLVIDQDAFLLRENTQVSFRHGENIPLLQILSGKILSVMAKNRPRNITTTTANLGIRGTGFYIEAEPERTYLCTCYGSVELGPANHAARETVTTKHHEAPRYIYDRAEQAIVAAPMINHSDSELVLLEGLVGRYPPFSPWNAGYY